MKKILIVEGDQFWGELIKQKLSSAGYEAELVLNGIDGLAKLNQTKPDMLLVNLMAPKMTGYELLEVKNNNPDIASIPVIALTDSAKVLETYGGPVTGVAHSLIKAEAAPDQILTMVNEIMHDEQPVAAVHIHQDIAHKKIMLALDDKLLQNILSKKITEAGADCHMAHSISDIESLLIKGLPDILVLDVAIENDQGYELLKKIKTVPATQQMPVIALSNFSKDGEQGKAKLYGAARCLVKAMLTPHQIIDQIQDILTITT